MSLGYCGIGRRRLAGGGGGGDEASVETHWPKSAFGSKLTCLALCEIIDKKDDFTAYPGTESGPSSSSARLNNEGIYVVPREDLVRFEKNKIPKKKLVYAYCFFVFTCGVTLVPQALRPIQLSRTLSPFTYSSTTREHDR